MTAPDTVVPFRPRGQSPTSPASTAARCSWGNDRPGDHRGQGVPVHGGRTRPDLDGGHVLGPGASRESSGQWSRRGMERRSGSSPRGITNHTNGSYDAVHGDENKKTQTLERCRFCGDEQGRARRMRSRGRAPSDGCWGAGGTEQCVSGCGGRCGSCCGGSCCGAGSGCCCAGGGSQGPGVLLQPDGGVVRLR